jgi:hypothetical protein
VATRMTMSDQMTPTDENEVEFDPEGAREPVPRSVGVDPHAVLCDAAGAEGDDWDLVDLEWRANESAAMDAYERGLSFA